MSSSAIPEASQAQAAVVSGIVHGGRQPVNGSVVTLWAAGNAGYGSAATVLASTTTSADGTFSFGPGSGNTYSCPPSNSATESQSIYITAVGGEPTTGVTNSQAAFMVALGDCLTIQSTNPAVNITEVTTIASMTALQQFFTPSSSGLGSFATSSTNTLGLANAMKTVAKLVDLPSGSAWASTTASGTVSGYTSNPVVTITPEQSKINTEADILAACVDSAGSGSPGCNILFANVGNTTPLDTLQAAYYLAINPTSTTSTSTVTTCNTGTPVTTTSTICNLFGLVTAQSPFTPALTGAPTDWTIGVAYSSSSSQTVLTTPVYFLNQPEYVAIDSLGNLWVLNSNTSGVTPGNSVSEIAPSGAPEAQVFTAAGMLSNPRNIVVDPTNNIFVGNYGAAGSGNSIAEFDNTTLSAQAITLHSTGPEAMASDGSGNIYVANYGGAAGSGDLEVIAVGATSANQIATSVTVGSTSTMAIDSYNGIWLSNGAASTTQFICSSNPCQATATTAGGQTAPQSIAVDHSNNIWIGNKGTSSGFLSELDATTTSTINAAAGGPFTGGGLLNPAYSIFGGLNNQWITNYATGGGTVSEITSAGTAMSPSGGFAHTYSGATGIAIDASGNVWVGNANATAPNGFITEIVGVSGPSLTPYSANLPTMPNGTNTIGNLP